VTRGLPPESRHRLSRGFVVVGTPEYMAPEQVSDEVIDGRADIYALGCVLYEMLTGVRAFDGPSSIVVMGKQLRDTPRPPKACPPARAIPAALDAIVVRAMAKSPDRRFQSAAEIRAALERVLGAQGRTARGWRTVATATLPCAALLAGSLVYAQGRREPVSASAPACSAPQPRAEVPSLSATHFVAPPERSASHLTAMGAARPPRTPQAEALLR